MIVSGAVGKAPFWGAHSETWAGRKEGKRSRWKEFCTEVKVLRSCECSRNSATNGQGI